MSSTHCRDPYRPVPPAVHACIIGALAVLARGVLGATLAAGAYLIVVLVLAGFWVAIAGPVARFVTCTPGPVTGRRLPHAVALTSVWIAAPIGLVLALSSRTINPTEYPELGAVL